MKTTRNKKENEYLVPKKIYSYNSVIDSLRAMVCQPNFTQKCASWKETQSNDGILRDIYDGQIWKNFKETDGSLFWDSEYNIGFSLNLDWFQPYKHSIYSIGAMYLVIQNLPRSERYKEENVILVGIIPGPNEPHHNMNSYLAPLVDELKTLWKGVEMKDKSNQGHNVYRAALTCITCDIPASRKCGGFLSHVAKQGMLYA